MGQKLISRAGIVGNGISQGAGAARRCHNAHITLRLIIPQSCFYDGLLKCRRSGNRCILRVLHRGEGFYRFVYRREHNQLAFVVQQGADGGVDYVVLSLCGNGRLRSSADSKDLVLLRNRSSVIRCKTRVCHFLSPFSSSEFYPFNIFTQSAEFGFILCHDVVFVVFAVV